jgi:Serine dehydrogenase proteinase
MNNGSPTDKSAETIKNKPQAKEQDDSGSQSRESASETREMTSEQATNYTATIYPGDDPLLPPLPPQLGEATLKLQKHLNKPVWLFLQNGGGKYGDISPSVRDAFFSDRSTLVETCKKNKKIVLLIDSLGGDAKSAYQVATLLRRYCGGFIAVVPRFAKSAATLLTLGADEIILGRCAELGPLDTQIINSQRNGYIPVLDKVKALERLHASALDMLDRSVTLLALRSGKPPEEILDRALRFAADVTRPLLENFDVDDYTRMSRYLKRGED